MQEILRLQRKSPDRLKPVWYLELREDCAVEIGDEDDGRIV